MTQIFQQAQVPLIIEVIPAFEALQQELKAMSNYIGLPAICHVAAHAGWLVGQKYIQLLGECEAYVISIGELLSFTQKLGNSLAAYTSYVS